MLGIALQALGGSSSSRFSRWRRQGLLPRFPDRGVRLDAHCILQTKFGKFGAELRALSVTRICQNHSYRDLPLHRLPNLLQGNLWLGLKRNLLRHARFLAAFGIVKAK